MEELSGFAEERGLNHLFLTVDPGVGGFEFVESKKNYKRALIVWEGQHHTCSRRFALAHRGHAPPDLRRLWHPDFVSPAVLAIPPVS